MQNKRLYWIGFALLLLFSGYAFSSFQESLTPYVPFETARASERQVQVAGGLEQGSSSYLDEDQTLRFTLVTTEGPEDTMKVRYSGLKPANFEDAVSIVAIGHYDADVDEFAADKLLVKCPSKYQGLDEEKSYG